MSDVPESDETEATTDNPQIRALDDATIRQIAAGEVVERPASVVKELVENSLDADASRVSVAVENGGKDGIRVRDDGKGMTESNLERAVEKHTTSKIRDISDLDAGVGTLGFRGEALHTVGAVSRLTVRSKPRNGGAGGASGTAGAGAELTVEGGDSGELRPAGCPAGTTVEVDDLFFNTPARKKFLKTDPTEFDHVNTVVTQYALANPDVAISLEHNGREVFATEGNGDLPSAVLSVYGREVAEAMVHVDFEATGPGPVQSVSGVVSHPETTRAGREYLSTFVNDRYVTAATLREGVLDAYGGQLAPDRYPFAVLFVEVEPDAVDVNVHPRKMEVRFDDESSAKRAVTDAVEEALLDHGLVRSSAPRGLSAPDETEVQPGKRDETEVVGGAGTAHEAASDVAGRTSRVDRRATRVDGESDRTESFGDASPPSSRSDESAAEGSAPRAAADRPTGSTESENETSTPAIDTGASASETDTAPEETASTPEHPSTVGSTAESSKSVDNAEREQSSLAASHPETSTETDDIDFSGGITAPTTQRTLSGDDATPETTFDSLPRMRVLGQLHDTYVVAETPSGLVLIDQHAADERVNYERLQNELAGDTPTQALADPVELELTAREAALFEEYSDALAQVGFHAGRTDDRIVEVRTVPAVFGATLGPELLRDVVSAFVAEENDGGERTVDAVADSLLADLACYPSITGNTSLTEGSVIELLETLDACENPYACPHGRPVIIEFGRDDIEARFERDYPGHAGRRVEE
ncbi:DNA mismatch repair protein MutL [Haloprofundus marisrubri]|uniref:DNA mismatch repair protein MutL n=1 Tax=Haloprofundus marisrubri TaxID=1514971 RepID=A0A0W1RBX3_9EURY|nr:DNA mismatch repair endonuclease MutL [Haloprofundus marisrubri]KTG10912.1 DNA mismatch repair protein MutL [Haloprofundus marisrubri]